MKPLQILLITLILSTSITILAQTPPVVYVSKDGSGDFNCNPDANITNNQNEINQALDFVAANPDFTTVYLKGIIPYVIDEPIIISSNTILTGDSDAKIHLKDYAEWWTHCKPIIGQKDRLEWDPWGNPDDHISNVEIYGFEIDGGIQSEPSGDTYIPLIAFYYPDNVSIHHMKLQNSYWDIIRLTSATQSTPINSTVNNNTIKYSGHEGICFVEVTNFEVADNTIYSTRTNSGIRVKNTNDFSIHNNIIGNSLSKTPSGYVGILVENETAPINQAEIYNNVIYAKNGGIHLTGSGGTYSKDTRQNVHIHHNKIFKTNTSTTSTGFDMEGGIKIDGFHNTIIEHNVIEKGVTDAISYEGTSGGDSGYETILRNNIIIDNLGYGINNKEPAIHTFISNNNLVFNNISGNYNNTTSSNDINSNPLFASQHDSNEQWFNIVGTYDNTTETLKIFINGKEHAYKEISSFGNIGSNTKNLFLGSYRNVAYWYEGKQDELAIWNRALTEVEITELYNNGLSEDIEGAITNGMQAYFKMENNWDDSSGNSYNSMYNTASFSTDAINGDFSGEFINENTVQYPDYLSTTNGLSISIWVNSLIFENNEEQTILNKGAQENNQHIWFYIKNESVILEIGNGTERQHIEANILNPWELDYHLKSEYGRWYEDSWVFDSQTSPCIDAGDPTSPYSYEPEPNGDRVNIGVYGNTNEASKSNTLSITDENINSNTIIVYPNPTDESIFISDKFINCEFKIYSVTGQLVKKGTTTNKINLTNLKQGVYFIKIDNTDTFKLIKK